jgi:outer membrane protein OmpA-like peptidoglycan-associated protein
MASIAGFHLDEAGSGERFLSWKMLVADGITLALSPHELAITELRFLEPGMKLVIAEDRSVNLTGVLKDGAAPGAPAPAPAPVTESTQAPAPYPFRIERIRLENGTLDFADLSLVLPFATRVHEVGGSIVNASSAPDVRARIELAGRVAEYGEARAEGSLIPSRPTEFLDIEARFDNVQVPALSPYSATFAGRKIAAGKLWLTLHYKIVDQQLAGENKIVLDDFQLGERVKAPGALDLPLDLAVALLKDSEGKITLAVPVTGDVDNPQFDYGKVISAAIGNAIARVVTAPFRMLGALFGKGAQEELQSIAFEAGSTRITPPQREKLDHLAHALKARPQLKLVVRGPYDPERDAERLRRERVRGQLAAALGMKLDPGERPGPIAFASAGTQKALEALLEAAEPDALAKLASGYAGRAGRQPERLNPVLGAFGRASKDTGFYEALYERLVELQPLPETAVRVLAVNRAQAMVEALTKAGVSRDRLEAGGITPVEADAGGSIEAEFALGTL